MLDSLDVKSAVDLCLKLSEDNISLAYVPDTPLGLLVRSLPTSGVSASSISYGELGEYLVDLSNTEDHTELLTNAVTLASQSVRRTLDFTRNVVMPHIRLVREAYLNQIGTAATVPMPYNMDIRYLPEIYKLPYGREVLDRWDGVAPASVSDSINLGNYDFDEVLQLSKISDTDGFNDSMEDLLKAEDAKGLNAITAVLSGAASVNRIDPKYSLPLAIVLSNIEEPKSGVEMTLSQYNANRVMMANVTARVAIGLVSKLDNQLNNNNLYDGLFQRDANTIQVVGEVYRSLLERGLTAEIVIGNELMGRKYRGTQLIDPEVMEELKAAYERDKQVRQNANQMNFKILTRKVISDVLRADQKRIVANNAFVLEGDTDEKSWIRLRELVDRIFQGPHREADPILLLAAVVCGTWYAHTDSARLIDIMFSVEKDNPNLPSKEVATIATLQYIAEWVASQVIATKA